jgi:hypothetical protein
MIPTFVTRVKVLFIDNFFHIFAICRFFIENPTLLSNQMLLGALDIVAMLLAHEVGHLYSPQKCGKNLGIPYLVSNWQV